jgi:hypothetical protein
MIDMKKWLKENCSLRNYDDPEVDPDKLVGRHRKALASARSALREHMQQQLQSALHDFYSDKIPDEKNILS